VTTDWEERWMSELMLRALHETDDLALATESAQLAFEQTAPLLPLVRQAYEQGLADGKAANDWKATLEILDRKVRRQESARLSLEEDFRRTGKAPWLQSPWGPATTDVSPPLYPGQGAGPTNPVGEAEGKPVQARTRSGRRGRRSRSSFRVKARWKRLKPRED
jgi:hypothetical protein